MELVFKIEAALAGGINIVDSGLNLRVKGDVIEVWLDDGKRNIGQAYLAEAGINIIIFEVGIKDENFQDSAWNEVSEKTEKGGFCNHFPEFRCVSIV